MTDKSKVIHRHGEDWVIAWVDADERPQAAPSMSLGRTLIDLERNAQKEQPERWGNEYVTREGRWAVWNVKRREDAHRATDHSADAHGMTSPG